MAKKGLLLSIVLMLAVGCTHSVHVSHVSDFGPTYKPLNGGELVTAKAEQFVILGFASETNYVDSAYRQLMSRCENGAIQGIATQYSTSHNFLSWTNHIEMQGLCIR